jgi:hypothetical protein
MNLSNCENIQLQQQQPAVANFFVLDILNYRFIKNKKIKLEILFYSSFSSSIYNQFDD